MPTWKYLGERGLDNLFSEYEYIVSIKNETKISKLILNRFAVYVTELAKKLISCPAGP
jgi:hypothetical protein